MSAIDLSQLSAPDVVEELDFETILAEMLADLQERDSTFDALVESDPAYKVLEGAAYREVLIRQRVNEAARSVMLAYAAGADLDHLAAPYGLERYDGEDDDSLRSRVQEAPEGWTSAGSAGSYRYHAKNAHDDVADVSIQSEAAGIVIATVLAGTGDGTPSEEVLDAVAEALSAEDVRPLCDSVEVQAAEIVSYQVTAGLYLYDGPDEDVVVAAAETAMLSFAQEQHRLGRDITMDGLYAALRRQGVQKVVLTEPTEDIVVTKYQAAYCSSISITAEGRDE